MKSFDTFNRQFEEWRQQYQNLFNRHLGKNNSKLESSLDRQKFSHKSILERLTNSKQTHSPTTKAAQSTSTQMSSFYSSVSSKTSHRKRQRSSNLMLIVVILSLTSVVGHRFYNQPQLAAGKPSPVTIEAPSDGRFEDRKTTEEKRREVQTGVIPILKQNREVTSQIKLKLARNLELITQYRQLTQPFPFLNSNILSDQSQQYIRLCSNTEVAKILEIVKNKQNIQELKVKSTTLAQEYRALDTKSQKIIQELVAYRLGATRSQFESLMTKIALTRYRYAQASKKLLENFIYELNPQEIDILLSVDKPTWQQTKQAILLASERILMQGIVSGIPANLMEATVALQLDQIVPNATVNFGKNLLLTVLQPNLEKDREATRNIAAKAALAIEPTIVTINKGETIVNAGAIISQADFVILDGFGLSRRGVNWFGLGFTTMLVTAAVLLLWSIEKKVHSDIRRRDRILLCLLSVSAPLLSVFNFPYTNLPAIGLLLGSFYHANVAIAYVSVLTGLIAFSAETVPWEYLIAGAAGGLVAATIAGKLRSRESIARLGMAISLTQAGVYLIVNLILTSSTGMIWYAVLPGAIINGLSGLAWSIIALGISPYLERFFDVVTPIRLAELSNPNLPLLKRLATETPGTFQHTMFVSSLAEAAGRKLNCNVELIRAGTLYHDIGKMHDPSAFIENQMGEPNKHDTIDNPWKSAEIIKKHVTEGLVMARKYGLPKAVRDFIPEHQGTLLISYFYHQAQQRLKSEGRQAIESDFRYDGPIPQSRETGIMMLADACEAALRSLSNVTPDRALVTIAKIFKARWYENQLVDSGLQYEELATIAEIFVQVWQQYNHKRIAYPKAALEPHKRRLKGIG